MELINENKIFLLGQYFTKVEIVEKIIKLLFSYKNYDKNIRILEPSFGTKNFIKVLNDKGFNNIEGCEIDEELTNTPKDFFDYPMIEKFDLIIGNPPFTKYNLKESYYFPEDYLNNLINPPSNYLTKKLIKKEKIKIENSFILKSIKHLKDENSTIGFVLPISFFIKNKNNEIKRKIKETFSTIIIYQNDKTWFDYPIPCCFAIFTNKGYGQNVYTLEDYKDKVILIYENEEKIEKILDKDCLLKEELIPKSFLYKTNNNQSGTPLSKFLSEEKIKVNKSYKENNVSGKNIFSKIKIPLNKDIEDYVLAVVRVGNASVGKTGLINLKEDILNDMFFIFGFKEEYNGNQEMKEKICELINKNQEHFKNLTFRVGSKSIKKDEVLDFKVKI